MDRKNINIAGVDVDWYWEYPNWWALFDSYLHILLNAGIFVYNSGWYPHTKYFNKISSYYYYDYMYIIYYLK